VVVVVVVVFSCIVVIVVVNVDGCDKGKNKVIPVF
jgi:hypothetical protein